ncbi:MAG: hypothetical protein COA65_00615 [Rhodospirillaceae bacterium]|nr:MAG: hypothetical protein COA65_00615 [Rhodospirillaceae bacterium]
MEAVDRMPGLGKNKVDAMIRSYFERLLSKTEEIVFLTPQDPSIDPEFEATLAEEDRQRLQAELAKGKFDKITLLEAQELAGTGANTPHNVSADKFRAICNGVLRARIEQRRIYVAMLRGAFDEVKSKDPLFDGVTSTGMPPLPGDEPEPKQLTLENVIDKFCAMKEVQDWTSKTADENRRILGWFREQIGPTKNINDINIEDVREFRDTLFKLPKHFTKTVAFEGMGLAEIAAAKPAGEKLGASTLQKYFGCVRWFLSWCGDEYDIDTSKMLKLKIGHKINSFDAREPFSHDQLKRLFKSPQFTGHNSPSHRATPGSLLIKDGKFWIPLIGLYTGMRLGEIVQLLVTDVREEKDVLHFDVNKGEGDAKKTLKTKSSVRRIPIHPDLIRMGFMDHVALQRQKNPKGRVFSEIKTGKNGDHSHNMSKYFGRYLKLVGVKTGKTTFHSFRHNFADALRNAEAEDSRIKALIGHAEKSTTGIYGVGVLLKVLAKDVERINYDLDFSHLFINAKDI